MNNLSNLYNNEVADNSEPLYLSFTVGDCKYAISTNQVVEIMKLPHLNYPQKLSNNVVGLLNYNNFTINILDIRFYLDIKVTPYSISNQLLVVKTDESIFGLLINRVEDIISIEQSKIEHFPFSGEGKLIDFLYKNENESISVLDLFALENLLKKGVEPVDFDITTLFPQDDESRYKFLQRNQALVEKSKLDLAKNIFSQDKFISFSLNDSIYCINLEYIREFLKNCVVTPIPCAPDYVSGLMTLRGDFLTVVDMKKFLNLSYDGAYKKNRVVVMEATDFRIGIQVDEIFSIMDIPEELINQNSHHQLNKYILSEVVMDDKLYTILNMKTILSDERFFINEKV